MNKFIAIALFALVAVVAVASASGYGSGSGSGYGGQMGGYGGQSYGQNYERKTGFKTVIYHPYGGVSNRFDYRTFPAYGGSSYGGYESHPAPYIKTGLEYSIQDQGYGQPSYGGNQGY